jgi:hypothetical protein
MMLPLMPVPLIFVPARGNVAALPVTLACLPLANIGGSICPRPCAAPMRLPVAHIPLVLVPARGNVGACP